MGLFEAVREALWLKFLATTLDFKFAEPIIIYEDNNGCINIANNPTNRKKYKHTKYHFSKEQVENKVITLKRVLTGEQFADILTKSLPGCKFLHFKKGLSLACNHYDEYNVDNDNEIV